MRERTRRATAVLPGPVPSGLQEQCTGRPLHEQTGSCRPGVWSRDAQAYLWGLVSVGNWGQYLGVLAHKPRGDKQMGPLD